MENTQGQKYVPNLFFGGIAADIDPEVLDPKTGTVLDSHLMHISNTARNVMQVMRGDKSFASRTYFSDFELIGGVWLNGYVIQFFRDLQLGITYIYANNTLIGQHADYPSNYFDIDTCDETSEMFITDNVTVPIVLNLNDMLDSISSEKYFNDYDHTLYEVNKPIQLNQPVFVQLEDLGPGGGLKVGSYAYAMCYSSRSGEDTPWSPITPYIPVPEYSGTTSYESYVAGLRTWGGQPSLTPGRYGIRLRLRIANLSGFDFIKIKRFANYTGQPINYVPSAEYVILTTDAEGGLINIVTNPHNIVEFVDSNSLDWAALDDSVTQTYSTIKRARTVRYSDRRIVLGGVEYESKLIEDKDVFIVEPITERIAFPVLKSLGTAGFTNIFNQVYYKSQRLGEKYGYGIKCMDGQGNVLYTIPVKQGEEPKNDFTNFQFPNRRDPMPVAVKRVDTISLMGTIGSANITCDGVTRTVTFNKTYAQTIADFVANHASAYTNLVVTGLNMSIIFTAKTGGYNFTGNTTIVTVGTGDLTGSVATTQANVVAVPQADIVFLTTGTSGTINCEHVARTVVWWGSVGATAQHFVDLWSNDYANVGVTLSVAYKDGDIGVKFTGPATGAAILTLAEGDMIKTVSPVRTTVTGTPAKVRKDTIGPTGTIGSANITCNGVTRVLKYHKTWMTSLNEFVAAYGNDFAGVVASVDGAAIRLAFTGTVPGSQFNGPTTITNIPGGNLAGVVTHTQANVPPVIAKKSVFTKTYVGGTLQIIANGTSGAIMQVTDGIPMHYIPSWIAANEATYIASGGVSDVTVGTTGSIVFYGLTNGAPFGTLTANGECFDFISNDVDGAYGVEQIDTITLTGTGGHSFITCNNMKRGVSFDTSLTQTAANFVTDYASDYANVGIYVSSSGPNIIFTALVAGVPFYGTTTVVNAPSDLGGTVLIAQEPTAAVRQVDVVTLLGSSGSATITSKGVSRVAVFNQSLEITANNFYTQYHADYEAVGLGVSFTSAGEIIFTGPTDGSSIVTTVTGTLVDNIYTDTSPVAGVSQIDVVSLSGTSGNVRITCNGITKGATFNTSLTNTAAQFVTQYASAYAPAVEVTSSGSDIRFRAITAGVPFNGATAVVHVDSDLTGTVVNAVPASGAGGEYAVCTGVLEDSTVNSWNGTDYGKVYDPVSAVRTTKTQSNLLYNIVKVNDPDTGLPYAYSPVTPTGRGSGVNDNKYTGISNTLMPTVDGVANNTGQYGHNISTVGLRIGGIDVSKLPSNVKSFSVVRTPAAGRVVCQGIGMYALTEGVTGASNPSLTKATNKIWFYSPELDSVIGTKSGFYEDIKSNPDNYQIQLVAPCGFFTDFYSSVRHSNTNPAARQAQDMVSMPICGAGSNARNMFPLDQSSSIGRGNYISFGRWRNITSQGTGIDASLTFNISLAKDVDHGKNARAPYLEFTLDKDLYAYTDVQNHSGNNTDARDFHEPWYIINIIQSRDIPNNNINSYNDIGHSIKIESVVGLGTGRTDQVFSLVDERVEDILGSGNTAATYRYIWVAGKPWLCSNGVTGLNAYLSTLEMNNSFTPTGGMECFGVYLVDDQYRITFPYSLPTSGTAIVPQIGEQVIVKYNNNSAITVFLGDTIIGPATFLAVDAKPTAVEDHFRLEAPMPHYDFTLNTNYKQSWFTPAMPLANEHDIIWDDHGIHHTSYVRQWMIYFMCESTVNLPLMYKDFFPNRVYAMRPAAFLPQNTDESIADWLDRNGIYDEYRYDYPEVTPDWWMYGGLSTPASANFDYEKIIPIKSYTEPKSGANEKLVLMKRFHWSTQGLPGYAANRVFIPLNVYDLKNDKASQISILYDVYSERGSNLYVITDRGAGMLLTDKNMITTAEGNNLTILTAEAGLIKGEVWLSNSIGCPDEFWRGKSEGSVKMVNNVVAPVLVFPTHNDIVVLSNNQFLQICDNYREPLTSSLEAIDLAGPFTSKLFSAIDEGENTLWLTMDNKTYSFNFGVNNWDGHVQNLPYLKSLNARYLQGVNDRNVVAHIRNQSSLFGVTISHKDSTRVSTISELPYVTFVVNPKMVGSVEFLDMFVSSTIAPLNIQVSVNKNFTDAVTAYNIKEYATGLYHVSQFSRTPAGKVLIGKTLYVKITFPNVAYPYILKSVKTGYKEIVGG